RTRRTAGALGSGDRGPALDRRPHPRRGPPPVQDTRYETASNRGDARVERETVERSRGWLEPASKQRLEQCFHALRRASAEAMRGWEGSRSRPAAETRRGSLS